MNNNPYLTEDEAKITHELQELENKVNEELQKPNTDKKKLYNLRFQQLMRGIYMTQGSFDNI